MLLFFCFFKLKNKDDASFPHPLFYLKEVNLKDNMRLLWDFLFSFTASCEIRLLVRIYIQRSFGEEKGKVGGIGRGRYCWDFRTTFFLMRGKCRNSRNIYHSRFSFIYLAPSCSCDKHFQIHTKQCTTFMIKTVMKILPVTSGWDAPLNWNWELPSVQVVLTEADLCLNMGH